LNRKRDGQQVVSFGFCLLNTFVISNTINYIYNASGQKVEKIVKDGATTITTNYLDGFQYKDNVLEFFPTAEGYVQNENGVLGYVFQYKDHLGNVRVSYKRNAQNVLEIVEENNYYAFGLLHKGYNHYVPGSVKNFYKYNGKELQDELGLNFYDYGARNYDPALGRWMNIDPLAEKGRRWSPYNYAMDNPVYFIDPDGMWPDNPFRGLIDRAKSAVKNYVANKVSDVISNTRNMLSQKASSVLSAMTPSNPFRIGKPDKPEKVKGEGGTSFTTEGGKHGGMPIPEGDRNVKTADMTNLVVFAVDVFGPETKTPGAAPDGSNPFATTGDSKVADPTINAASAPESETTEIKIPTVTFDASPNSKSANLHFKDTIVNKKDSARVSNEAQNKQQNDIKKFNKKHGTNF